VRNHHASLPLLAAGASARCFDVAAKLRQLLSSGMDLLEKSGRPLGASGMEIEDGRARPSPRSAHRGPDVISWSRHEDDVTDRALSWLTTAFYFPDYL
jgi:hypothetical protein